MPDAATSAYLAKHYLDGVKAEALLARTGQSTSGGAIKKRKKKRPEHDGEASGAGGQGLRMVDADDESWKRSQLDDEDEEAAIVPQEEAARAKRKRWNKLGETSATGLEDGKQAQASDDAEDQDSKRASASAPSFRAGLKTGAEMRAERLDRERLAAEAKAREDDEDEERRKREEEAAAGVTVYRDATGRKIDIQAEEEQQREAEKDQKRKDRERQDWNKGEAQLREARQARKREEQVRNEGVTRYANDVRMNEELRQRERAIADPAAAFLSNKSKAKQGPKMPTYKGGFPPNRFGIRPGYRWDGVERGNGFEAKLFQRRNERNVRKDEERAWRQEDM